MHEHSYLDYEGVLKCPCGDTMPQDAQAVTPGNAAPEAADFTPQVPDTTWSDVTPGTAQTVSGETTTLSTNELPQEPVQPEPTVEPEPDQASAEQVAEAPVAEPEQTPAPSQEEQMANVTDTDQVQILAAESEKNIPPAVVDLIDQVVFLMSQLKELVKQ